VTIDCQYVDFCKISSLVFDIFIETVLRPKTLNELLIFLTACNISLNNVNIFSLIFMNILKVCLNIGKQSLSLIFSAVIKLDVNKKIGWLSLSYPHRHFSIQSFLWARRAQSGSRLQRQWSLPSLKHEICLMNQCEKFYPNWLMIIN